MRRLGLLVIVFTATLLQAADPALMNLAMPDAKIVAGVNLQRAKTSELGQFLLNQFPVDAVNLGPLGFDPKQDLTELLFASNGQKSSGIVIARGTFRAAQIMAALSKDGKQASELYNGAQLLAGNGKDDAGSVAFLPSGLAIAGNLAAVKAAIDRSAGNNAIDPALAAKIAAFSAVDAWSISLIPIDLPSGGPDAGAANPFAGALKNILQASGSITLSSPVQIAIEAQATSDQDAQSLSDVLKFLAMMVQTDAKTSLLNALNVTTDHSTIKVTLSIPEDQLEQLIKSAKPSSDKAAKKPVVGPV